MSAETIKYCITTKKALKPDTFSKFIRYVFDTFLETEAKKLANSFIGDLGRRYNKTNHGFTCTEHDTAMGCWTSGLAEGKNVTVEKYNGIYLIREQKCERIFSDNSSVNRFVVSQAILKCLQLIWDCMVGSKKAVLYGYNTDGIYIRNTELKFQNKKDVQFKTENIGKAYKTDSKLCYFEKHYRNNLFIDDYEIVKGIGCIYNGKAGSGKTELLADMVLEVDNSIVLSFTNKAIENVKKRLRKKCDRNDNPFSGMEGRTFRKRHTFLPALKANKLRLGCKEEKKNVNI